MENVMVTTKMLGLAVAFVVALVTLDVAGSSLFAATCDAKCQAAKRERAAAAKKQTEEAAAKQKKENAEKQKQENAEKQKQQNAEKQKKENAEKQKQPAEKPVKQQVNAKPANPANPSKPVSDPGASSNITCGSGSTPVNGRCTCPAGTRSLMAGGGLQCAPKCSAGQHLSADGKTCVADKECTGGMIHSANGTCVCPAGMKLGPARAAVRPGRSTNPDQGHHVRWRLDPGEQHLHLSGRDA
jgi:hypothetical protein